MDMPILQARQYLGSSPKAANHDVFWQEALEELDGVEPLTQWSDADVQFHSAKCQWLRFQSVGGTWVSAKVLRPKTPGKHPAVLMFHGYTADSGDWLSLLPYAAEGFVVAAMDCRGQAGATPDDGCYAGYTVRGHITRGLAGDPKNMLFRKMFLDAVQLARVMARQPDVDPARMASMGNSQGGALSIACSALSGQISRTVIIHPWLSDFRRCMELTLCHQNWSPYSEISDFFRRLDPLHLKEDEYYDKLSYIDVQHLASRIQNPVLMFITQQDNACPPSTQYAVYNHLTCEKQLVEYPEYDHEWPPQMSDRIYHFLRTLQEEVED